MIQSNILQQVFVMNQIQNCLHIQL